MTAALSQVPRVMLRSAIRCMPFKPVLYRALRRAVDLPERVYRHLSFHGPIQVPVGREASFRMMHFGHQVENDLFWAGFGRNWEATSLRLWLHLARRADVALDIGANTGVYALAAAAIAPKAQVMAFEPVARIHHRLVRNCALNAVEIATHQVAVSDHIGHAVLYDLGAEHVYSAGLTPNLLGSRDDVIMTPVRTARLDAVLEVMPHHRRLLAKIDTEGHEAQVIDGFGTLIERHRPTFLIEILDRTAGARIAARFAELGYLFFEIREREGVIPTQVLGDPAGNYLICDAEEAAALGLAQGATHAALAWETDR